jgi:hypothetical protein
VTLDTIKQELDTRNVIAWATEQRYSVNLVRVGKGQRVLMVCINGKVISEKLITADEHAPAINEVFKLRKLFGCEYEE